MTQNTKSLLQWLTIVFAVIVGMLLLGQLAHGGTLTGQVQTPTQGTINNATFTFTLSQNAVVSGTATLAGNANCWTDSSGNVRGLPGNAAVATPSLSTNTSSGTLGSATYFVRYTWANASGESEPSAERSIVLSATGTVILNAPANVPSVATSIKVYISTTSGTETLQGSVAVTNGVIAGNYSQSSALVAGSALPSSNTSTCTLLFNDQLVPSYTGYNVLLTSVSGSSIAGYPQKWYLNGGSNGTVNVSVGLPLYSGVVVYPQPILSQPAANGTQSINGPLNMNGFSISNLSIQSWTTPGQSPWIDVTDPKYGAKCDGVTNDTVALQAALTAANNNAHGGTVYIPPNTIGACTFASQLVMDNFTNVRILGNTGGAWPGAAGGRVGLLYTGNTSPGISARNCFGCSIDGIYLTSNNASLTGTLLSYNAVAGGNAQSKNVRIVNSTITGLAGNTLGDLITMDQAVDVEFDNVSLSSAKVLLQGAATVGSFANNIALTNVTFGNGGSCNFSTAAIQNPGTGWVITDPDYEVGSCTTPPSLIGVAGGFVGPYHVVQAGGFAGDQSAAANASTWYSVPAGAANSLSITGGSFGPNSNQAVLFNIGNNATLSFNDAIFQAGTVMASLFQSGATNVTIKSSGVQYNGATISNFFAVNFPSGAGSLVVDQSGNFRTGSSYTLNDQSGNQRISFGTTGNMFLDNGYLGELFLFSSNAVGITPQLFYNTEGTCSAGAAGTDQWCADSTAHAFRGSFNGDGPFTAARIIGTGTVTTAGSVINTGTSQAQTGITVTGATATDTAACSLNAAPPASWQTGIQMLPPVVTSNTVTVWLSNPTAGNITPAAVTVRCTVTR